MLSVLLLGATGYLGGSVLTSLESTQEFDIVCTVRPGREEALARRAVKLLVVAHDDVRSVESACARVDIVINAATSDDLELTRAITRGLKKSRKNGRKGVLVHVSGTQLIESAPTGKLEEVPVYDDMNIWQIATISKKAAHRRVDLEVVRSDLAKEIVASIICPGVIFGRGSGPYKTISSPFPWIVRQALQYKRVLYAGEGTNIWCHVHVSDVCDLIMASLRYNLGTTSPAGFARFCFAENGEHQMLQLSQALAGILFKKGLVSDATPLSVPIEVPVDSDRDPGWPQRTTSRCHANRARRVLGWTPRFVLEDMFEYEIEDILSADVGVGAM